MKKRRKVKKRRKLLLLLVSVIASRVMFNAVLWVLWYMSVDFTQLRVYFKMIFHGIELFNHFAMQNNGMRINLLQLDWKQKHHNFIKISLVGSDILWYGKRFYELCYVIYIYIVWWIRSCNRRLKIKAVKVR